MRLPVVKIRASFFHLILCLFLDLGFLSFGFFFIGKSLVQELSLTMFVKYIAERGINPTWGFSCCCVARQNISALKSPINIFLLLQSVIAISGKKKTKNPTKSKSNLVTRSIFHINGQKSKDLIWYRRQMVWGNSKCMWNMAWKLSCERLERTHSSLSVWGEHFLCH